SVLRSRLDPDLATVRFDQSPTDGEPNPSSLLTTRISGTIELLENLFTDSWGNPRAVVSDRKPYSLWDWRSANNDRRTDRCVLDGVLDEIRQHLIDLHIVEESQ